MIVYKKISWVRMFFTLKGSIFTSILPRFLAATLFAVAVTLAYDFDVIDKKLTLTTLPFSLIGMALGIFLGFRNNSSYDRFWEGRKLWGRMINLTRTITRQVSIFVDPESAGLPHEEAEEASLNFQQEMVYRLIAYLHAFRHHLRDETDFSDCRPFLSQEEYESMLADPNPPIAILHHMGKRLRKAWKEDWISEFHLPTLEHSLLIVTDIQGGCERIKKTPIPFAYTVLMHRIVGIYCFALPFGIFSSVGDWTPIVVALVSYGFMGLDAIGNEIEEPFGMDPNDLPLSSFCNMLERECRHRLGEKELPPALQPVDHIIS